MQAYYAALNRRDAESAFQMWSQPAPDLSMVRRILPQMLERNNPSWTGVGTTVQSVEGDRARARVRFALALTYPGREPSPPTVTRSVMTFVREAGTWRIFSEKAESRDVAERLMEAPDEAAVARIVSEDREAVTLAAVRDLNGLAGYAAGLQRYEAAIRGFLRAIRLAEAPVAALTEEERLQNTADVQLAAALSGLAQAYIYQPQPDPPRAIELLNRALVLHQKLGNEPGMSDVQQALGNAFYAVGDYAEALDRYQLVLPIARKQQDQNALVRTQLGIGNVQYLFGQYELALAAYAEALEIYTKLGMMRDQPRALQGLGRVQAAMGDFPKARGYYEQALAILQQTPQVSDQAGFILEIARIDFQEGKLADAHAQYTKALTLAESAKDAFSEARALYGLGLLQVVGGQFDQAIERYTKAIDAFQRIVPPHADGVGQTLLARASAKLEKRDLPGALQDFSATLPTFEATKNREGLARAHLGLAMTHVRRKEAKLALEAATRARDFAERAVTPDVLWQARHEAGRALLISGDSVKARQAFEDAVRILESTRFEAGAEAEGQSPAQRTGPYVALVEWHAARQEGAQALIAAEAAKRRVLEDLLRPFHFHLIRGLTPERQAEERRLVNQRVSLMRQMRRERDLAKPSPVRIAALEKQLASARSAAAMWQEAVARDLPALVYQRGGAKFTSVDTLATALAPRAALVQFVVGDERTTVIVATHPRVEPTGGGGATPIGDSARESNAEGEEAPRTAEPKASAAPGATSPAPAPTGTTSRGTAPAAAAAGALDVYTFTIDVNRQDLAEQVWRFTDGIASRAETVATDARALYDLLLRPAGDRLYGRSQLIVIPDDSLWTLPFEALMPAEDRYLIQDKEITAMPSVAAWLSRPPATGTRPLLTLAAAGQFSDISPLQTRLTFQGDGASPAPASPPDAAAPNPADGAGTTVAAWELFERDFTTDDLLLPDVMPKPERLRIDAGRLGATGLYWALQVAGARRVIVARRAAPADLPTQTTLPLPHPHDWATWLVIGPPEP